MNKNAIVVLVFILAVLAGGYYLLMRNAEPEPAADMTPETGVSGQVIAPDGSVEETADLEADLNASGADTDEDMRRLEAEFESR